MHLHIDLSEKFNLRKKSMIKNPFNIRGDEVSFLNDVKNKTENFSRNLITENLKKKKKNENDKLLSGIIGGRHLLANDVRVSFVCVDGENIFLSLSLTYLGRAPPYSLGEKRRPRTRARCYVRKKAF